MPRELRLHVEMSRRGDDFGKSEKLAVLAYKLQLPDLDLLVLKFKELKRWRDKIAHGREFDEEALPTGGLCSAFWPEAV